MRHKPVKSRPMLTAEMAKNHIRELFRVGQQGANPKPVLYLFTKMIISVFHIVDVFAFVVIHS